MSEANQQSPAAGQQPPAAPPPAPPPAVPAPPAEDRHGGKETVTDRIKRAKRTAVNALLTELGFDSIDALKQFHQTAQTAQGSIETERGKVTTLETAKADLEKQINDLKAAQLTGKVDGAIVAAVSTATVKAQYPQDVVKFVRSELADKLKEAFDAEGKPDEAKLTALVDEVKKQRPTWFGSAGAGSPSNRGGKPLEPNADLKAEARKQLRSQIKGMA